MSQTQAPSLGTPAPQSDDKRAPLTGPSATTLCLFSLFGFLLWPEVLRNFPDSIEGFTDAAFTSRMLPPALALSFLFARMLLARRWWTAVIYVFVAIVAFPLAVVAQQIVIAIAGNLGGAAGLASDESARTLGAIAGAAFWLWIGLRPWRMLSSEVDTERGIRIAFGLLDLVLLVFIAGFLLSSNNGDGYSVRSRVSELILAGSSAKTGLSEGMQTYGSWSPEWTSAITISSTGLVASARVTSTGVITVWGTAPTSGSVVTMIPMVTTDNKLVWSCVGRPAKYMPASCR